MFLLIPWFNFFLSVACLLSFKYFSPPSWVSESVVDFLTCQVSSFCSDLTESGSLEVASSIPTSWFLSRFLYTPKFENQLWGTKWFEVQITEFSDFFYTFGKKLDCGDENHWERTDFCQCLGTVGEERSRERGGLHSVTVLTSFLLCWPGTAFPTSDYSFPF